MKRACLSVCLLALCLGSQSCAMTGTGPAGLAEGSVSLAGKQSITPRSKGGTLNITPQSKGGTLKGAILWPREVAPLPNKQLILKIYSGHLLLAEGQTSLQGHFTLSSLPLNSALRLEAQVPGKPFVVLRRLIETSETDFQNLNTDISMLSTAELAVLQDAQKVQSRLAQVPLARLAEEDAQALLAPLVEVMTPFLDASLSAPIESQPGVQAAITQTRQALEKSLDLQN